ncbi:hypothetical protein EIN_021140 [Entamoeba invadens IP1]|uniref:hypothetical protein n=1 Tax=Entamoeba invadens IP1 TaxID=370355 RepID=UPI0002C3D50E|nr:hypothetical protein EIN_021140 [Entamoeba invadens IP1]ELP90605.1 hypothetical protein EIN_021140 [Entamoeba invadens IP1]|eukprot:XP_004257376.1 hypothetical protein EIN_021140 [Entamoeba invadens IP1]
MEVEPTQEIYYEVENRRFKKEGNTDADNLGHGAYGSVTRRIDLQTKQRVAVKRFDLGQKDKQITESFEEFPLEILREIKVLRELQHDNIVPVVDFYFHRNELFMVMEYEPSDLQQEIHDKTELKNDPQRIQKYLHMILSGVGYLHANFLLHRDLKPANILVSNNDILKIADFGSVRPFGSSYDQFTKGVITPYYRPPEVYFEAPIYGPAVDVWSIGCIFAEMCSGQILFCDERSIVSSMYQILGTPNSGPSTKWEGVDKMKGYNKPLQEISISSLHRYVNIEGAGFDLLQKMLRYDPNRRVSCEKALSHQYFSDMIQFD